MSICNIFNEKNKFKLQFGIFKQWRLKMQQIIKKTETILDRLERKIEALAERFF